MIKRIRTEHLEPGMVVEDFNTPWINHPFLRTRRQIQSTRDIQIILDNGIVEVLIDTAAGKDSPKAYVAETPPPGPEDLECSPPPDEPGVQETPTEEAPFEQELRQAHHLYREARSAVVKIFEAARRGLAVEAEAARESVEKMIGSIFRNRDALLGLARLRKLDDYAFQHSVNVALLCLGLGTRLGIVHNELLRLGLGALLHDVGKARLPEELLGRPGPLHPQEYEAAKLHTAYGAKILMQAEAVPDECSAVALNHHERFDASGYPRGLQGSQIGKLGLIAAIADVYDAMSSERCYERGISPHQALRRLFQWAGTCFHPVYVRKFVQCLGIYPVGTVVALDTGEVGVVWRPNYDEPLRPQVRLVRGSQGNPLAEQLEVDLREASGNGEKRFARTISGEIEPARAGVDVERVLAPKVPKSRLTIVVGGARPPS